MGLTEGDEEVLEVGLLGFGEGRQGSVWGGHCSCYCMIRKKEIGFRLGGGSGIWDASASRTSIVDDMGVSLLILLNRGKPNV